MIFRGSLSPAARRRMAHVVRWAGAAAIAASSVVSATPAGAESYVPVSGAGSTWSFNAIDAWRKDVEQYGMRINYQATGSSDGRRQFLNGTVDFAASDIPFQFQPEDGSPPEKPAAGSYAYMPVTAGGTVFMYNLTINGQRVTNLRLSGSNIAKIFTGALTKWDDPAIAADNPGLTLPAKKIVPVVRSDGSGSSAQFTLWMVDQQRAIWEAYCRRSGRSACGSTSYYPTVPGMVAQKGDDGVAGYVAQRFAEGAIGYVNYSYALQAGFPVAKMLNAAGYYTEPTPNNVAVSLLKAKINTDASSPDYLTQQLDEVYSNPDRRTYPLSSYSYMILPTKVQGQFSEAKGRTLGAYSYYAMCQGQQASGSLGYSPMPINLVQAGFEQVKKIPGVVVQDVTVQNCKNPTFSSDGRNLLAEQAPMPEECDKQGPVQCATGTGGARKTATAVKASAAATKGSAAAAVSGSRAARAPGTAPAGGSGEDAGAGSVAGACGADDVGCAAAFSDPTTLVGDAVASPLTLAAGTGWSGTHWLIVLVAALTLALVLVPGLTMLLLARGKRS